MSRRKPHEEHENHERWLVSYADFITLLFAFFTVLYATSQRDVTKQKEFEQSIRKHFNTLIAFGGMQGGSAGLDENINPIPPPIEMYPSKDSSPSELEETIKRIAEKILTEEEREKSVTSIKHDSIGVEISLASGTLFPSGTDQLSEEGLGILSKIGAILKASGKKLIVQGHTDNQTISTARFPSNWELSASRATRIIRYLNSRHQIDSDKMVAVAYGDQKPIADNATEDGRAQNRRIEILIVTDSSLPKSVF